MDKKTDLILGVLLRTHRRAKTLRIVLDELLRYGTFPGISVRIHVSLDRPTAEVADLLESYRHKIWGFLKTKRPLLSAEYGELFMPAANEQLAAFEKVNADWYLLWDDDSWYEPLSITEELPSALTNPDIDVWTATTLYFWDTPFTYRADRPHYAPSLFRVLPGDRFPLNRILLCTENRFDTAFIQNRIGQLKTPIFGYGTFDETDRRLTYEAFATAGKVDSFTLKGLQPPPRLDRFPEDALKQGLIQRPDWTDLWTKYYGTENQPPQPERPVELAAGKLG